MNKVSIKVNDIYLKVQNLLQVQNRLTVENQQLIGKNQELTKQLTEGELKLKQLEEQNKVIRIAQSLSATPKAGSQDLKFRINELVREVDKCMAMLNS